MMVGVRSTHLLLEFCLCYIYISFSFIISVMAEF